MRKIFSRKYVFFLIALSIIIVIICAIGKNHDLKRTITHNEQAIQSTETVIQYM